MNLKLTGIGLVALTAVLLLPSSFSMLDTGDTKFWGSASMVAYDAEGNEVLAQTVHNRIVDTGEQFILVQTFAETAPSAGAVDADLNQMGAICAFTNGTLTNYVQVNENVTAANVDFHQGTPGDARCQNSPLSLATEGKAILGPTTFSAGAAPASGNVTAGDTIHGIAVCQANATGGPNGDWRHCEDGGGVVGAGIMLSIVDTSDVTLALAETVDITYTFDITSPDN